MWGPLDGGTNLPNGQPLDTVAEHPWIIFPRFFGPVEDVPQVRWYAYIRCDRLHGYECDEIKFLYHSGEYLTVEDAKVGIGIPPGV